MPQITVKRISEYSNKLRNIKLFMNGQEIYKIQSSETPGLENTSLFLCESLLRQTQHKCEHSA